MAFTDLRQLRKAMQDNEIGVYSRNFAYNGIHCYIAICLLTEEDRDKEQYHYALARIRIMKTNNLLDYIDCPANSTGLNIRHGLLRRFFQIEYDENGAGEWLPALMNNIGNVIRPDFEDQDEGQLNASIYTVCQHEGRDPNRIFPHHLLRHFPDKNGNCKHRTEYNAQLAALQYPTVYPIYRNDRTVSFAFVDNEADSIDERTAYDNFVKLEESRGLSNR